MPRPARFEMSQDIEACCEFLRSRHRASYQDISTHLGRDVRGRDRYILLAARRKLERKGIVFVVETGIGIVRATHPQIAQLSTKQPIDKIGRVTRRAKKREQLVDIQQLSDEQRLAFNVGRAVLGAIEQAVRVAFRNEAKREVQKEDGPIP